MAIWCNTEWYATRRCALATRSNIYLNELDRFVEQELLPQYNQGKRRQANRHYSNLALKARRYQKSGRLEEAKALYAVARKLPSQDPADPGYRRQHYVRYADDWLLGFAGPRQEAEEIKERLRAFLGDCLKLELSEEKTLITHASWAMKYVVLIPMTSEITEIGAASMGISY